VDIVLVPGLWLNASSWDEVVSFLEDAGHRTHPLTLPGMDSRDTPRSQLRLRDHIDAVVAAIDACQGDVVLVAHSAGCGVAYGAIDARPGRIGRAVLIGGFPTGNGHPVAGGFRVENGGIPLPEWSEFDDADLADLTENQLRDFRSRAIPSPAHLTSDLQQLTDERRHDVPITAVATEYTSDMLREWIAAEMAPVREFTKIDSVDFIDLPTGHWPQLTRPRELAEIIRRSLR